MIFDKLNNIHDVIFDKSDSTGINRSAFYPKTYYKVNQIRKISFLDSLSASIKAYYQKTTIVKGALYFSLGNPLPKCEKFKEVKLANSPKAKTRFLKFI